MAERVGAEAEGKPAGTRKKIHTKVPDRKQLTKKSEKKFHFRCSNFAFFCYYI